MTVIKAFTSQVIEQNPSDPHNDPTCFGLQGSKLPPLYCNIIIRVDIVVDSNQYLWARVSDGRMHQSNVIGTTFPSYLALRKNGFIASPDLVNQQDSGIIARDDNVKNVNGTYDWTFINKFSDANIGEAAVKRAIANGTNIDMNVYGFVATGYKVSEIEPDNQGRYYLYIGGTTYGYVVTDPNYPNAVPVEFVTFRELVDYFPFAVYQNGSWKSCNRSSGKFQHYDGSKWIDRKNTYSGTGSHTFNYNNGWKNAPKIGAE